MAAAGRDAGRQERLCRDLAAAGGCAGRRTGAIAPRRSGRRSSRPCAQWARAEAGAGRLLPWVPVAFGTGIAFYFAADHEPVLPVAAVTAIALCVAAFLLRRHKAFPVAVMIAAVAAGFAIATWKTARIAHGVLARPMFSVSLTGFVETRDIRERTDRFVLRVVTMESARGTTKLERVRLSVKKGTAPDVGSFVELKARLLPPLAPLRPGSYDFGRDMFFAGIGASGFVMGAIKTAQAAGWRRLEAALFGVHAGHAGRDRRADPDHAGRRQARDCDRTSDRPARRDLRARQRGDVHLRPRPCAVDIRLSHGRGRGRRVLCGPRAAGAVSDASALRSRNGRRWRRSPHSAFYLLLSGAEVATQRSFFMHAVALIAVMVDRRAITFRTLVSWRSLS